MPKSYTVDDDYNDSRLDKWFKNKTKEAQAEPKEAVK